MTIPAGDIDYIIEVALLDDIIVEGDEHFVVHLSTTDSNIVISTATATVTIQEDDSKRKRHTIKGAYSPFYALVVYCSQVL